MAPKLCHTRELKSCKEESFGKGTQEQVAESADGNEEQPEGRRGEGAARRNEFII